MADQDWKLRLAAGIEASGKSQREISLAAGMGPGYVNSLINEGKDATVGHLKAICDAAGFSFYFVIGGFDITPEREEFLRLLEAVNEDARLGVLNLLRLARQPEETPRHAPLSQRQPAPTRE